MGSQLSIDGVVQLGDLYFVFINIQSTLPIYQTLKNSISEMVGSSMGQ